jgi:hypothetical protein
VARRAERGRSPAARPRRALLLDRRIRRESLAPRVSQFWLIMFLRRPRLRGRPWFLRGGLLGAWTAKSCSDDDPAEFDGHVVVGRLGLRRVPAGPRSVTGHVVGGVPVQGVPDGDHAEQISPNGTVRSTARRVRLRASPTPTIWRAPAAPAAQRSAVPRTGRSRRERRPDHRSGVRATDQHQHREKHLRRPTQPGAPRPPRTIRTPSSGPPTVRARAQPHPASTPPHPGHANRPDRSRSSTAAASVSTVSIAPPSATTRPSRTLPAKDTAGGPWPTRPEDRYGGGADEHGQHDSPDTIQIRTLNDASTRLRRHPEWRSTPRNASAASLIASDHGELTSASAGFPFCVGETVPKLFAETIASER